MSTDSNMRFHIRDVKFEWLMSASTQASGDGKIWIIDHPTPGSEGSCEWSIEPVPPNIMDASGHTYYYIRDSKFNGYLTTGLEPGFVGHSGPYPGKMAMWSITPVVNPDSGLGGFLIKDALYGKCLTGGFPPVYRPRYLEEQKGLSPEQLWYIECMTPNIPAEAYPEFFIKPGSVKVKNLKCKTITNPTSFPHSAMLHTFNNGLAAPQHMKLSKSITTTMSQSLTTEESCWEELSIAANAKITSNFFFGEVSIGVSVKNSWGKEHRQSNTHTYAQEYSFTVEQEIEIPPMTQMEAFLEYNTQNSCIEYEADVEYALIVDSKEPLVVPRHIKGTWCGTTLTSYQVTLKNKGE